MVAQRVADARRAVEAAQRTLATAQNELQQVEQAEAKLTPEELLAIDLNGSLCNWNHTDGCSWLYEVKNNVHEWNGYAHAKYLEAAQKLAARFPELDFDFAREFTQALKGI